MRVVFFNHKGGVSKTTTTFHLGWKLAEQGKRVLLVDADPQCNLTGLIMDEDYEKYYIEDATKDNNLLDGVNPAFQGRPQPIGFINCYNVARNPNLFLLPGHPNLTELEPPLSFAQTAPNAFGVMQNLPGAFNMLIENTCNHHNIDYVLIDLNPGLSAINQNLFSISDLFIIPTNPDPFSLMAIKTLSTVLPRWYKAATGMKDAFKSSSYPFPDKNPKFGGVVIQRFNIRNGLPAAPFRNNMDDIIKEIASTLVPSLKASHMMYDEAVYDAAGVPKDYCISEIPDFQSLLPQAHKHAVPVFALTNAEIEKTGYVLTQLIEKRATFNGQFDAFANRINLIQQNA